MSANLSRLLDPGALRGGCHGLVVRDGIEDACGKPVTVIIDGRSTEDEGFWPACTYHGHRYGRGNVVPLGTLLAAVRWRA
jgi:hypothetical protein